jgi:Carboxypeptidase regulatory-like domain
MTIAEELMKLTFSIFKESAIIRRGTSYAILTCILLSNALGQNSTTGWVKGTVKDPQNNPVEGAVVQFLNTKTHTPVPTVTDNKGEFTLFYLQPGYYNISVSHDTYDDDEKPGFYVSLGDLSPVGPHPPVFTLGLTALTGRVEDPTGGALKDYKIMVVNPDGEIQKAIPYFEEDGTFTLRYVRAGRYKVVVKKRGYEENSKDVEIIPKRNTYLVPPSFSIGSIQLQPTPSAKVTSDPKGKGFQNDDPDKKGSDKNKESNYIRLNEANVYNRSDSSSISSTDKKGKTQWMSLTPQASLISVFREYQTQLGASAILGKVVNSADKDLADVTITIIQEKNKRIYATLTDSNGEYYIPSLETGIYTITASKKGYAEGRISYIHDTSQSVKPAPKIKLAETTGQSSTLPRYEVEVNGGQSEAIKMLGTGRGDSFDTKLITTLPLGGTTNMRTFDDLAFLVPGVAPPPYTPGPRGPGVGFGVGTAGKFSVNGLRSRSNNFSVDGSDNNDPDVGIRRQGFIALVPQSLESINEFQILTLLWDAEPGRNSGSQVNVVSKYGGNAYHGQAYTFFTDSILNARNFFDYTGGGSGDKDPFTRVQAGFVFEGPIIRDRSYFFGSFERIIVNTSTEQHFSSPQLEDRHFLGKRKFGVLDPLFTNDPSEFFQSTLGTAPLGRNILSFYPQPNNPGGPYGADTYTQILPASGKGDVLSFKITQRLGENKTFDARYNFTGDDRILPSVNRGINSTIRANTRTQNLSLILTNNFTAHVFNQTRFSYGRTRLSFAPYPDVPFIFSSSSLETVHGIPDTVPSTTGPIGEVVVEPFSPVGVDVSTFPQNWVDNTFQFANSTSVNRNGHSIKFGGDVHRIQLNSRQERNYRPQVVYSNAVLNFGSLDLSQNNDPTNPNPFTPAPSSKEQLVSGLQLAAIGLPTSIFQTITAGTPDSTIGLRFTEIGLFFNDNWRVRSNLVFDYGVRYEYNTVPHEVNGRIEDALTLRGISSADSSTADTPERQAAFDNSINAYRRVLGGRTRIYDPDRNNFAPHFGFAWAPWASTKTPNAKTVFRGGYGIYFDAILGAVVSQSRNVFPNEIPINIDPTFLGFDVFELRNPKSIQITTGQVGGGLSQIPLIATGTLNQLGGTPSDFATVLGDVFLKNQRSGGLAFTLPSKKAPSPYAQHWHLIFEHQLSESCLVSAAYVGTKGTYLTRLTTPNLGPNVTLFIPVADRFTVGAGSPPRRFPEIGLPKFLIAPKSANSMLQPRPIPALGPYQLFENSANSNYHGLQLEARKRYSQGYTFTVAYTWSHAIDDVSDIFSIAGAPILPQDSSNLKLERASANFDVRHHFVASLVWDLPFYRTSTSGKKRWLAGWQTAFIFQANTGQSFTLNVPVDANFDGNLTDRPSTTDGLQFFQGHGPNRVAISSGHDVTDFFTFGQDGFVGRNTARGNSFVNLDLALNKNFLFRGSKRLEFRTEFFNLFNRANFGLPIRTIGAPGFGSSVDTLNPARTIQFALKVGF